MEKGLQEEKEYNSIFAQLEALRTSDHYPFHMPGHKRNMENHPLSQAYGMDITEIDGFDNLHNPQGILLAAMKRAAGLYKTRKTFFLVNGSTAGILAAIHSCVGQGEKILISRNCHQSVYNAIALLHAKAAYLYPPVISGWNMAAGLPAEEVRQVLARHPDAKAVFITSPTYEGMVSPVKEIADIVHEAGIPLIVDEAHGAHFPFSEVFPVSALYQGADLVIQSIHKTLPAFTQTALLHLQGNLVQLEKVRRFLAVFQTSSPSYLLMEGIEDCLRLVEEKGAEFWKPILKQSAEFMERGRELKNIDLFQPEVLIPDTGKENPLKLAVDGQSPYRDKPPYRDPLKLLFAPRQGVMKDGKPYTSIRLYRELLERYHLQMEMVTPFYILGILTCMDREEGLIRLERALWEIDARLEPAQAKTGEGQKPIQPGNREEPKQALWENRERPYIACTIAQALNGPTERIPLRESRNRTAACFVSLYPPGIPLIVPGEVIDRKILDKLLEIIKQGLPLQGLEEDSVAVVRSDAIY